MVEMFDKYGQKFMQLPKNSIFNDYQLLFNLRSNIEFKSFMPYYENEEQMRSAENLTRTMNLPGDIFQNLLELYPETAKNLRLRALEKRSIYMYYKSKVGLRRGAAAAELN